MSVRIFVRMIDTGAAQAGVSPHAEIVHKSFVVESPELESWLLSGSGHREVIGAEFIAPYDPNKIHRLATDEVGP